jgi:ankyrin repeat protein
MTKLINLGANVNAKSAGGFVPLHITLGNSLLEGIFEKKKIESRLEIVKLLVAAGAGIDAQDNDGISVLHYAIADCLSLEFLLQREANRNLKITAPYQPNAWAPFFFF